MHAHVVTDSLRAFMTALIDYAGLFPPAKLPLSEAVENYTRYRHEPDHWMLSRFIIPAAGDKFRSNDPFVFSVLGHSGSNADEFFAGLHADLEAISAFRQEHGGGIVADVFEVRLPANTASVSDLLEQTTNLLAESGGLIPFYEVPFGSSWESTIRSVIETIAQVNAAHPGTTAGFKIRCGGVEASAFPTPAQIALALTLCRDAGVPLKATAGLHHPIRRYRDEVQTKMHGFLNVFGAGLLAHVHQLALPDVQAILEDEAADHFRFENDQFCWQSLAIKTDEIMRLRQKALISYGSCSFDEPRDDLRQLNLL
jgi:hypothetical protein